MGDRSSSIFIFKIMKRTKKSNINDDERWNKCDKLKASGDIISATKLKFKILELYKWKKPCHHM